MTSAQAYRRDRWAIIIGMAIISLLTWAYMVVMAAPGLVGRSHHGAMPDLAAWDLNLLVMGAVMWSVMMIAMMLPTAAPMVLGFSRVLHRQQAEARAKGLTWVFVAGYLLAWVGFSLPVALAQWALYSLGLMSSAMGAATPLIGGAVLIGAGLFQCSRLKDACLAKCQSPLGFLLNEWRPGSQGALIMGLRHGLFCIGCCWLLMLLMFAGGVMNLFWMAAITVYVLAEKLLPSLRQHARFIGALLIVAGVFYIFGMPVQMM